MTLTGIDFRAITAKDIAAFVAAEGRLGVDIAFEADVYELPFVRDISSLANTQGGLLLIGIAEKYGAATGLTPLTGFAAVTLWQLRLRARSGISQPVRGVRMRAVKVDGGFVAL